MTDKRLVIVATHGADDPERATIPFAMANAALATDIPVTVVLQSEGVRLATKDYAKRIKAEAFPPLADLISDFQRMGGMMMACTPCLNARKIDPDQLLPGTKAVAAASAVDAAMNASASLVY